VLKRLASCLIAACSGRLRFRARLRPHAWPLAIDELCSGSFEGSPHGREILGRKHSSALFEISDCNLREIRPGVQPNYRPIQQSAGPHEIWA